MSVVPCRFFGTANGCRYGDNCKFYHAGGLQNISGGFGGRPQGFNSGMSQAQQDVLNLAAKSQQNMDVMIEMVKRDMVEWEQSHIFPFSCYGPSAGKPCLPGFEEISTDELRYRFYVLNNKTPLDLSREVATMQQARMQYQQISPGIRNILERVIVKGERISSSGMNAGAAQNTFGGGMSQAQPKNIFGSPPSASNPFLQTSATSLFGGSSTTAQTSGIFGGTSTTGQASSLFGGSTSVQQPPVSSIFGSPQSVIGSQTSSVFGNPSVFGGTGQPIFGAGIASTTGQQQSVFGGGTTGSLFGTPQQQAPSTGTSLFGSGTSVQGFGATPQTTNLFSQTQAQPVGGGGTGGLFSTPPNANIFGTTGNTNPTPQTAIFGQQQQPSQTQFHSPTLHSLLTGQQTSPMTQNTLFGNPAPQLQPQQSGLPASGSFFGSPTPPSTASIGFSAPLQQIAPPSQPSLFGTPPTSAQSPFFSNNPMSHVGASPLGALASSGVEQKFVYTDESELTPEELEAFRAPTFTLENIPIRPPPKSLCGL